MASADELAAAATFDAFANKETEFSHTQKGKKKSLAGVKVRMKDVNNVKIALEDMRYYLYHGERNPGPPAIDPSRPLVEMKRGEMIHILRWAGRDDKIRKEKLEKVARKKAKNDKLQAELEAAATKSMASSLYSDNASVSSVDSKSVKSGVSFGKSPKGPGRSLLGDTSSAGNASGFTSKTRDTPKGKRSSDGAVPTVPVQPNSPSIRLKSG